MAGKSENSFAYCGNRFTPDEINRRDGCARMCAIAAGSKLCLAIRARRFLKRHKEAISFKPPTDLIASDAEQIAGHCSQLRIESAPLTNQTHENLLDDVFGDRHASAHVQREAVEGSLPALV